MWQRGVVQDERCGCGESFSGCAFWRDVGAAAFGGWDGGGRQPHRATPRTRWTGPGASRSWPPCRTASRDIRPDHRRSIVALLRARLLLHRRGQRVPRGRGLEQARFPGLLPALAGRARPAGGSRGPGQFSRRRLFVDQAGQPLRITASGELHGPCVPRFYQAAAGHWNVQNQALQLLARTGTPTLRVRYEDLVTAPATATLSQDRGVRGPRPRQRPGAAVPELRSGRPVGRPARGAHGVGQPDAVPDRPGRHPR